jgi:hypothetical protein
MLRKIINLIKHVYCCFWKKRKHLKILSQNRPIDQFWSGPETSVAWLPSPPHTMHKY